MHVLTDSLQATTNRPRDRYLGHDENTVLGMSTGAVVPRYNGWDRGRDRGR